MPEIILQSVLLIVIYATCWFVISLIKKRNDVADIAWGLGYILLCVYFLFTQEITIRSLITYTLVLIWGLRLSIHIYLRNRGKTEDFRYKQWREKWGKTFYLRSYLQVYILQGLLLLLVISSVMIIAANPAPGLSLLDWLGITIWIIGFYFETVGDYQLVQFIKNPANKDKIMKNGLWKYTRHPNYFGEVTMWWGLFLLAINVPNGLFALISPLTITTLILFVSGIPMLEKKYEGDPEYEKYKMQTSKFFPLPPKTR